MAPKANEALALIHGSVDPESCIYRIVHMLHGPVHMLHGTVHMLHGTATSFENPVTVNNDPRCSESCRIGPYLPSPIPRRIR